LSSYIIYLQNVGYLLAKAFTPLNLYKISSIPFQAVLKRF